MYDFCLATEVVELTILSGRLYHSTKVTIVKKASLDVSIYNMLGLGLFIINTQKYV